MSGRSEVKGLEDAHQLAFNCPLCGQLIAIYVHLNGKSEVIRLIWGLTIKEGWNDATIEPSIQLHPVSRKSQTCPAHFCVKAGVVTLE